MMHDWASGRSTTVLGWVVRGRGGRRRGCMISQPLKIILWTLWGLRPSLWEPLFWHILCWTVNTAKHWHTKQTTHQLKGTETETWTKIVWLKVCRLLSDSGQKLLDLKRTSAVCQQWSGDTSDYSPRTLQMNECPVLTLFDQGHALWV